MKFLAFLPSVAVLTLLLVSSGCVHDAVIPDEVTNPIDTTTNNPDPPTDTLDLTGNPCSSDTAYFQTQVLPLLVSSCAKSGCHDAASRKDGVIMTDYAQIMSTGEVRAGKPNSSELYEVIVDTGKDRMPPAPASPLSADQKNLIKKWIEQGAKNNTCNENYGACTTTGISYSNFIQPLMTSYCVGCHGSTNPSGGISLNTYITTKASAQNGSLYGSVAHAGGYAAMPQGGQKLSDCALSKIKAWIDGGMPEN